MAPLPTIYLIHAADAPQHLAKLIDILKVLKAERRIGDFFTSEGHADLASFAEQVKNEDLILTLLTHDLEHKKTKIESILRQKARTEEKRIVEIIVDNIPYENEFITLPTDLKPIRNRGDMDAVWNNIGEKLKLMFQVQQTSPEPKQADWRKHLKVIGGAAIFMLLAFAVYKQLSNDNVTENHTAIPDNESSTVELSAQPRSDFPGGSSRVYSADFSQWPITPIEHGLVSLGFGNSYVLQPSSNVWIGSGPQPIVPELTGDFVFDLRFQIEERNPSSGITVNLAGGGNDAESIDVYLDVWEQGNVTYSLTRGRIRSGGGLAVPHVITEEIYADRSQVPAAVKQHNWTQGGKLTMKRDGGDMQVFINDVFVKEFRVSTFPVVKTSVGVVFASKVVFTSAEARVKN